MSEKSPVGLPPTMVVNPLTAMSEAFQTSILEGGQNPKYKMVFQFESIEDLHRAEDEWKMFIRDRQSKL